MVFARAAALPGRTMRLSAPLLVLGPNVPSSRAAGVHTLDLGGRTAPLFNVSGSGQLLLHKLVRTHGVGAASRPMLCVDVACSTR